MRKVMLAMVALAAIPILAMAGPQPGDPAPDFSLPDSAGVYHRLSDYRGSTIMLMFWQSG